MTVKWNCWGEEHVLNVELDTYCETKNPAVLLTENGANFAIASVNIPEVYGAKDLVAIKDYSENMGVLGALQAAGVVSDALKYVQSGWVEIPICRLLIKN